MKTVLAIAAAALVGAWLAWPASPVAPALRAAPGRPTPPVTVVVPPAPPRAPVPAASSMADTRLHGDPLSPPIGYETEAPQHATAQELADPAAYAAFEARQTAQIYAAYVRAVDQELPRLRADIARARSIGIDAREIEKAETKARGLEQMRKQLLTKSTLETK
jgi:hypothetical protein